MKEEENNMGILTKYIVIYKMNENKNVLINTLNSAIDVIDNNTRMKIENMMKGEKEITCENEPELYQQLKSRGYIYEKENEETEIKNRIITMDTIVKNKLKHKGFTICPTMGCNLRCTYCFESEDLHKDFSIMTEQQVEAICEYILEQKVEQEKKNPNFDKINPMQIKLFGGEPLLKCTKNVVEKILKFSALNNIRVAIITNGTTIPDYIELLEKYKKIIAIQITVDGSEKIHNQRRIKANGMRTFSEICENIELILKLGITIQFRINVDKENIYYLNELEEVIRKRGWGDNPFFIPYASPVLDFCGNMSSALKEHELYEILLEKGYYGKSDSFIKRVVSPCIGYVENFFGNNTKIKPWKTSYCEATSGGELCFAPDGLISTCLTYIGKGELSVGKFDETGVYIDEDKFELWSGRNVDRIPKCRECKFAFLCGGGCPVMALEKNGEIDCCVCSDIEKTIEKYIKHRLK